MTYRYELRYDARTDRESVSHSVSESQSGAYIFPVKINRCVCANMVIHYLTVAVSYLTEVENSWAITLSICRPAKSTRTITQYQCVDHSDFLTVRRSCFVCKSLMARYLKNWSRTCSNIAFSDWFRHIT